MNLFSKEGYQKGENSDLVQRFWYLMESLYRVAQERMQHLLSMIKYKKILLKKTRDRMKKLCALLCINFLSPTRWHQDR